MVWIAVVGWTHRWMTEDGFIYLRIVEQVRQGNGPVFNDGERVEAFTGVLWVGILSLADLVTPVRLEWLSVVLGLVATVVAVALAVAGARRLWAGTEGEAFSVPLGAVVFVAVFPAWAYATSGLETGLVFTWLGGSLWILARWARDGGRQVSALEAVVLGLGWLVRPELVVFSALFLVVTTGPWSGASGRARVRVVAAALAIPVAYQVFRMGFYGSLVTNTAIAKEGAERNWGRGWDYLLDFAEPYWLWLPLLCLAVGGYVPLVALAARARDLRRIAVMAAFVLGGAAHTVYVVAVGGDYHHGRMFLPALFAVCAPVAVVPATRRHLAGVAIVAWAVVAAVALRPEQYEGDDPLANGFLAPHRLGVTVDDYGWGDDSPVRTWFAGPPAYHYEAGILRYPPADLPLDEELPLPFGTFWGVGVSAYSVGTDFHVLDQMGLADPFTSHLEATPPLPGRPPRYPGHEKPLPCPWLAARVTRPGSTPFAVNFPPFGNPLVPPTTGAEFQEQVAWARAALACDPIAELLESTTERLTARRFAANFLRSVRHTQLRIPPDPESAYRRFCGDDTPPEVAAVRAS